MQPENLKCISTRLFPFIMKVKDFTTNGFIDTSQGSYEVLEKSKMINYIWINLITLKVNFIKKSLAKPI